VVSAREIMAMDAAYVDDDQTVGTAAAMMRDLEIGSLPVCSAEGDLEGVLTEHDIVVNCLANGSDPFTTPVRGVTSRPPIAIEADQSIESALLTMALHHLRRIPVIDGGHLVGVLEESEVAQSVSEHASAEFLLPSQRVIRDRSRGARPGQPYQPTHREAGESR
jgi:CBS domain-containing protein